MEIKNMIEALEKEGYKVEAPQKKEVAWNILRNYNMYYWYVSDRNEIKSDLWEGNSWDYTRHQQGNVFTSEKEAKKQISLNTLTADYLELIRQTNEKAGLVIDWEDETQFKTIYWLNNQTKDINYEGNKAYQVRPSKWYWLINGKEGIDTARAHFTDNELKAIITQGRSLL